MVAAEALEQVAALCRLIGVYPGKKGWRHLATFLVVTKVAGTEGQRADGIESSPLHDRLWGPVPQVIFKTVSVTIQGPPVPCR